jgi:hypothetical protein
MYMVVMDIKPVVMYMVVMDIKPVIMYMVVMDIEFTSVSTILFIRFWNSSDKVIFFGTVLIG